jgi:prophage DNA circulation protein
MIRRIFVAFALICLMGSWLMCQEMANETKREVPELTAFHEVIYSIWHTAYPAKDAKALRSYLPQINELAAKIYTAKLPGILREKEAKWKEGVAQLQAAVEAYRTAASGKDDQALLNAAEALHTKYEGLVRVLNPVLQEMDAFHQSLYVLNHKYLPEKAYDKIRGATTDLVAKAEAITKAALPKQHAAKGDAFKKAAAELLDEAKTLDAAGKAHDHAGMEAGVEKVHAKYQALQSLFE